jgi:hypothetical protein
METVFHSDRAVARWEVDELLACYIAWRDECRGVRLAYRLWLDSAQAESRLAYAQYVAALDREERAARTYAAHIEIFSRKIVQVAWASAR